MIFRREWKRNVRSMLVWGAIISALILLILSMYPQFAADQQAMNDMLAAYPEPLKKAFGMDVLDFGTLLGFYSVQAYLFVTLIGSVYAALLASGILVKEESEKTIEFLLSKPVTRGQVVAGKLAVVAINLLALNVIMAAASLLGFQFADERIDAGTFAWLSIGALLLHLTFAALAFILSAVMRKSRSIVSASLGLVFLSYALDVIAGISDQMSALRHVSFFHYIDASEIVRNGAIEAGYAAVMGLLIAAAICAAFLHYRRKDITV